MTDANIKLRTISKIILGWMILAPIWIVLWSNNNRISFTDKLLFYTPIAFAIFMLGLTLYAVIGLKRSK